MSSLLEAASRVWRPRKFWGDRGYASPWWIVTTTTSFSPFCISLYQVASATLSPADIAAPIRHILRGQDNITVLLGEISDIDLEQKRIALTSGARIPFDFLILATGVGHSYFRNESWSTIALGLKTLADALEIRHRFLVAFELAEQETDPEIRKALLTFVIVGGGASSGGSDHPQDPCDSGSEKADQVRQIKTKMALVSLTDIKSKRIPGRSLWGRAGDFPGRCGDGDPPPGPGVPCTANGSCRRHPRVGCSRW